ncbi:MAG: beta strand repeat-containing protein [Candidatus Izemoplasmatales bacterium]
MLYLRKNIKFMRLIAFFLVLVSALALMPFFVNAEGITTADPTSDILEFTGDFTWDDTLNVKTSTSLYITYTDFRTNYCTVSSTASECASAANGKFIRFDTAEELYRFSVDVSYEHVYISSNPSENVKLSQDKIAVLLSLNYVLGNNIDYSVMGAKTFIPIGYWFSDVDGIEHKNIFTGSFDGQGFVVKNLYVAGYDYLVYVDQIDAVTTIDIALSNYYSMFPFNGGEITDFGLYNPTFELLNLHIDITKASNIVGINLSSGVVDHVYVIDDRTDVTEAGIRYKVGTATGSFQAAGIIHTNQGTFTNAYYVSKVVVNGSYINKFSVQPVLYLNQGTISNLVYDSSVYLLNVTVGTSTFTVTTPNSLAVGESSATLKSSSSSLNTATDLWYFYASDTYPLLQGLVYDNTLQAYLISTPIDLAFFSRVIAFLTERSGVKFSEDDYVLTNDIDMSVLAPGAYATPSVTFTGTFSGYNSSGSALVDNYYIYNLNLTKGVIRGTGYYVGLFSIIGTNAVVSNFNISQSSYTLATTESYYSYTFYAGSVAGRLTTGTIEDIITDVDIDMGTTAIGKTYLGGVAGEASGLIQRVATYGSLNMNSHTYDVSYNVNPKFYIGGSVGGADLLQLKLKDTVNYGDIYGFGTTSTFNFVSGVTSIETKVGGVIGYILNTSTIKHQLVNVANNGDIYLVSTTNTLSIPSTKRIGGVFGELSGYAPVLESSNVYQFANLYNTGTIHAYYESGSSTIQAAGIGISNTSTAVEYALLFNHGTFDYDATGASYASPTFKYTGTIFDVSSSDVTLSRVYNYGNLTYTSNYYTNINALYYSLNDNQTLIRFSANYGDISYMNNNGASAITLAAPLYISGITTSNNVNFLNVVNGGEIAVVNVNNGSHSIYISGITTSLQSGYYIKNSLNQGNITFAKINGTANIYVGGIVVSNYSGDLHLGTQSTTQPIATVGIINTMNYGNISTSYGLQAQNLYGITGSSNTFVGGIATLNAGSIQDTANLGNVSVYNSYTSGVATFATDTNYAGLVTAYTAGVVVGGVVGVTLSGNARVYDTGNNGDINAIAYKFARSGGVLGVSLYDEASAGGITSGMGLVDTIENSVLSNGLNFGSISAITYQIGTYTTSTTTQSFTVYYLNGSSLDTFSATTTTGTQERPQINASAGGVIGYGLSVMKNMLNHGTISSTDVAGGIVGATYALGSVTTVTHITTAINYGGIKSISTSSYNSINKYLVSTSDISAYYMADGNSFIFPSGYTVEMPRGKRGFGGIFGRLQRGTNGVMTSEGGEFDFIVNANPNIDLIGRLDQVYNFSSSSRYFRFNDAIYYSAKWDDTTQVVFTGFYYGYYEITSYTGSSRKWYITVTAYQYEQVGIVSTQSSPLVALDTYTYYSTSRSTPVIGQTVTSPSPFYYSHIPVPWITENPSDSHITDSNTQYMYDADFEMRTNSNLSTYIYYMEYNLLADRFKTTGTNPRPNGMYVLSTTAGSTFGSVLPANINTDTIGLINEDYEDQISLLIDYSNLSIVYHDTLDSAVLTKYYALRQTIFNEKSELIPNSSIDVVLTENGGSSTVLSTPTIDYDNHTITYQISMEAYLAGGVNVTYQVSSAQTSLYALIAERPDDYYGTSPSSAQLLSYRTLLFPEKSMGISTNYAPVLSVTLPSKTITSNTTLSLGYLTVFSEAFVGSDLFASGNYYTNYHVYVTFTPQISSVSTGTIGISSVSFNGGSNITVSSQTDIRSLGDVNYNGTLTINFQDSKHIWVSGYDFKNYFVLKYNDGSIVPSSYYTVTSSPVSIVSNVGYYSITFTFIPGTRMGDYYFEYRYYASSSLLTLNFDKAASSDKTIFDFSYYSDLDSILIAGTSITSSVNIGTTINMDSSTSNFTSSTDPLLASYLSNITYNINYMNSGSLSISPFASITSARLVSVAYNNGYITYTLEYIVRAENNTTATYTHTLTERATDLSSVLKNGNEVDLNDVFAVREDLSTDFSVDLGFDQSLNLYQLDTATNYISVSVTGTHLDGITNYDPSEILGITYTTDDYLHILMSYDTLPGIYSFTFTYTRDTIAHSITFATTLIITKRAGTDPYLTDIRFSDLANETEYPIIRITDQYGEINTTTGLDPRVYFDGIDYDEADTLGYQFFRVDGTVANTPLNDYMPYVLNYLPYGATIAKYAYNSTSSSWYWTDEVTAASTSEEKAVLLADFTKFADTGQEPGEGEEVVVLYRVTSEDGSNYTYYYVTVTDVVYNVTLIFDIYYCEDETNNACVLASESVDFANQLVIINVKNYDTNGDDTVVGVTNPADYPTFSTVNQLNNQMTQFYFTYSGDYRYSFGRNISGFYVFDIELPLDQYLNDMYTYDIVFSDYTLNDASNYVSYLEGKYFYIEYATKNRSRRFNVYIHPIASPSTDAPWGLFDFFRSWKQE